MTNIIQKRVRKVILKNWGNNRIQPTVNRQLRHNLKMVKFNVRK